MKSRLTLLLLLIATITHAQYDDYDYYYHEPTVFGLGIGTNLVSEVGNDVRPVEISLRVRFNRKHTLQLYVPFFNQSDSFKSKDAADMGFIRSSLETKKSLFGVGLDYDYALYTFSSLDFVVGLRAEFQYHKYRTELTNQHPPKNNYNNIELTHRSKKTTNYLIGPNAGLRLNFNKFSIDAKFLLSMLSMRGDVENMTEKKTGEQPNMSSTTKEWTDELSNNFKLKPGAMVSVSYYF